MSQEDPTIVVTPVLTERFIGGAAIVAAHARGLGVTSGSSRSLATTKPRYSSEINWRFKESNGISIATKAARPL